MRGRLAFGPAAALLLLVAPSMAAAAPRTHVVTIEKMKFGALPADVRAGDTIIWDNRDMFKHTATAKDGSFDIDLPAGARGTIIVKKTGAIAILCRFHPGMRAMLKVGAN